jgi:hypothetical protein
MSTPIAVLLAAQTHGQGLLLTPTTTIPFTLGELVPEADPAAAGKSHTRVATPEAIQAVAHILLPHLANHLLLTHPPTHPIHAALLTHLPPAVYHPRRPSRQPLLEQAQALLAAYELAQAKLAE